MFRKNRSGSVKVRTCPIAVKCNLNSIGVYE